MYVGLGQTDGWGDVLRTLALQGGDIAQQRLTRLRAGEYIQTAEGVRAMQVPGAVPTSQAWPGLPAVGGGFGVGTWLVMGVVVLGVVLVSSRK